MDRISGLPDDLLLKILSILPTKVAVSTSLLSKRWEFVWMWMPKLEYVTRSVSKSMKLECFINRTLPYHRAPVIESFRLNLNYSVIPENIKQWVVVALSRQLRELDLHYNKRDFWIKDSPLPSSLYACKSLVILKLGGAIRLDVPRMACLPSLTTLHLGYAIALDGESLQLLLSFCPFLENLSVDFCYRPISGPIRYIILTLQSLSLYIHSCRVELEIDTPSLKYFKLQDCYNHNIKFLILNMPKLEEAYVDIRCNDIESLIGSITSVKRLTISCPQAAYSNSFVFNQLEHLKLCNCTQYSSNLLARFLKDSPNLQVLDIFHIVDHGCRKLIHLDDPSTLPKCCPSTLQTFNWSGYLGRPRDRDVVVYILKNACGLRTATISFDERLIPKKLEMIEELSSYSRASTTCQLIFD